MDARIADSRLLILNQVRANRRAVSIFESIDRIKSKNRDAIAIGARAQLANHIVAQAGQPTRDTGMMLAVTFLGRLWIRLIEVELGGPDETLLPQLAFLAQRDEL